MSAIKDKIINRIIETEGGYVNNPYDSGGPTRYGITEKVARNSGYSGDMKDLPYDLAYKIYDEQYWSALNLDNIELRSEMIAYELSDTGVNIGVMWSAIFFQRCLNALNRRGKLYHNLKLDAQIGPKTIGAFYAYMDKRGKDSEKVMLRMLNSLQGAYYIDIAEKFEKNEEFVFGWFRERVSIH